jgi:hypothetical protein
MGPIVLWDRVWDCENISDALLVSVASLYRWQNNIETYGSVVRPGFALKGLGIVTGFQTHDGLWVWVARVWVRVHKLQPSTNPHPWLGIGTGNPGVFQGYLYPYPSLPVPASRVRVLTDKGCGFLLNC